MTTEERPHFANDGMTQWYWRVINKENFLSTLENKIYLELDSID